MEKINFFEKNFTATFEVTGLQDKGGKERQFKRIYQHAAHEPDKKHKNKDILTQYTAFQKHDNYEEREAWKKQQIKNLCDEYIKEHDKKMIAQRKKSQCYHDVEGYLKHLKEHNKSFCRRVIGTFSNYDDMQELYKKYGEEKVRKASVDALVKFVNGFNEKHKHVKIVHYYTNTDEKGAPHVHMQMIGLSKSSKTGKPSVKFNNALKEEYGGKGGKDTLALFRQSIDSELVNTFGEVFKKELDPNIAKFNLYRLNKPESDRVLDFETYKAGTAWSDELEKREENLKQKEEKLKRQKIRLQQQAMVLAQQKKEQEKRIEYEKERVRKWDKDNIEKLNEWQKIESKLAIAFRVMLNEENKKKFDQDCERDPIDAIFKALYMLKNEPTKQREKHVEKVINTLKTQTKGIVEHDDLEL